MALVEISKLTALPLADGVTARSVHNTGVTVAYVRLKQGADVPEHRHTHEQITTVIEGELELTVEGESTVLTAGKAMTLGSNVAHSARALTACYVIDVFQPVREDFRKLEASLMDSES